MGRKKATKRTSGISIESVKLVDLPSPKMVTIDLNLANNESVRDSFSSWTLAPILIVNRLRDALVKLRVIYRKGSEADAIQVIEQVSNRISSFARYVFRPEITVISEAQARIPGLTSDLKPIEAVNLWLENRPGPMNKQKVLNSMKTYIGLASQKVDCKYIHPKQFMITNIKVENFMPFRGEHSIDLLGSGVYGVTGTYQGADGRSNRAGKSAFLEAVLFGLFGDARPVTSVDKYIHHGEDEMNVTLTMMVGGIKMTVSRSRTKDGKSTVAIDNIQALKIKEGDSTIVDRLGFNKDDFVRSAFVLQGDLYGILGQKNSAIKHDLVNWLDLNIWEVMSKDIAVDIKIETAAMEKVEAKVVVLNEVLENECPSEKDCEEVRRCIAALKHEYEVHANLRVELTNAAHHLEIVEKCDDVKKELAEIDKEQVKKKISIIEAAIVATEKDVQIISEGLGSIELDRYRIIADGKFDGVCPIDKNTCPRVTAINKNSENSRMLYTEMKTMYNEKKTKQTKYGSQLKELRVKSSNFTKQLSEIESMERFLEENCLDDNRTDLESKIVNLEKKLSNGKDVYDDIVRFQGVLAKYEVAIKTQKEARAGLVDLLANRDSMQDHLSFLGYLRFLCSNKGIPSMQIENAVMTIESQANDILKRMGVEYRLEFSFERELKSKATACYVCGYSFDNKDTSCKVCGKERGNARSEELVVGVRDAGNIQDFDQDSGGGKTLLALAVRVALAKYLGMKVLFLDEVCGSLDVENLKSMIEMVGNLTQEGFDQVFIISHRHEVADAIPNTIVVQRDPTQGRSELLWA